MGLSKIDITGLLIEIGGLGQTSLDLWSDDGSVGGRVKDITASLVAGNWVQHNIIILC